MGCCRPTKRVGPLHTYVALCWKWATEMEVGLQGWSSS